MLRILAVLAFALSTLVGPMTGKTFFEKNAQRIAQWNPRRRNGNHTAAQFTLHTFEAKLGSTAMSGATYLLRRTTHGSYHWLFDAMRNFIRLAPWSAETWHSVPTNNWAASASAMMNATDWRRLNAAKPGTELHTYRANLIYGFALAAADFSRWLISQGRDPVPKRILTTRQALAKQAGFVMHRDTDPARRTDPANPRDEFPWDEFFAQYDRLLAGDAPPTPTAPTGPSARPDIDIQLALAVLGYYDAGPALEFLDGKNGAHQKAAVTAYQRARGLQADGWWGTNTDKHFEENDMSTLIDQIVRGVLTARIPVQRSGKTVTRELGTLISGVDAAQDRIAGAVSATRAEVAGVTEAVTAIGEVSGMDRAAVQKVVADTVEQATVTFEIPKEN